MHREHAVLHVHAFLHEDGGFAIWSTTSWEDSVADSGAYVAGDDGVETKG